MYSELYTNDNMNVTTTLKCFAQDKHIQQHTVTHITNLKSRIAIIFSHRHFHYHCHTYLALAGVGQLLDWTAFSYFVILGDCLTPLGRMSLVTSGLGPYLFSSLMFYRYDVHAHSSVLHVFLPSLLLMNALPAHKVLE